MAAPAGVEPPPQGAVQSPPRPPKESENPPTGKWTKDYDGRKEPLHADQILIWIPRAPLYPVHLLLNYGVRIPITRLVTLAEKHKVFQRVQDFFTFADGKAGIYPTGFYDAGRGIWGGLNFFYNDLGRAGHNLRATVGMGTANWLLVQIKDSWRVFENDRGELSFSAGLLRNPNLAFTGLGPDTARDDQVFFQEEKLEGAVDLEVRLAGLNRFSMRADFKYAELESGRTPSIEQSDFDTSEATGFDERFTLGGMAMALELDSRNPKDEFVPGSGVALKSWGSYHYGPSDLRLSFFRYGLRPRIFIDFSGANHVLQLGVRAEAVTKVGGEDLPYNELIYLGGREAMVGFLPGRFRGDSSLVYQLEYSWPLLSFADAYWFAELGNVFSGFYSDFNHELMALDWGTGLRSSFSRELEVFLAVGFGTNQIKYWDDAFVVDQVRFLAGATRRF